VGRGGIHCADDWTFNTKELFMTHITIERAKLDQVLETLERLRAPLRVNTSLDAYDVGRAITAIKQAQTQPVQEPFCFFYVENGEEYFAPKGAYVPDNAQPLYTTPPVQPAVPDAFGTREGEHPQYIQGWNDCRAEMLKGMKT